MILIAILLLVCLYLFWHFDKKRKWSVNMHREERRKALMNLLNKLRSKHEIDTPKSEKNNET